MIWPFRKKQEWDFPLFPQDLTNRDRLTSKYGVFGYKRSYYFHQGIDLYTVPNASVMAAEDGEVVAITDFTGPPAHPHWLYTQAVLVSGPSGVICYGEVEPKYWLSVGDNLKKGDKFANVVPVIPEGQERPDIPGHSRWMLHFEWYKQGVTESVSWHHKDPYPEGLLDPTEPLTAAWDKMLRIRQLPNSQHSS